MISLSPHAISAIPLNLFRDNRPLPAWLAAAHARQFETLLQDVDGILHESEARYFKTLKYDRRRLTYLLGRYAAKTALSAMMREPRLPLIEIVHGVFNQPVVRHPARDVPEVSLSHSDSRAVAIAFPAGHMMGIDLEEIDPKRTSIMIGELTRAEVARLSDLPLDLNRACCMVWTIKEALSKSLKCGLTVPCEILEVERLEFDADQTYHARFRNFTQYRACSWPGDACVLSIVLPRKTSMFFNPLSLDIIQAR